MERQVVITEIKPVLVMPHHSAQNHKTHMHTPPYGAATTVFQGSSSGQRSISKCGVAFRFSAPLTATEELKAPVSLATYEAHGLRKPEFYTSR